MGSGSSFLEKTTVPSRMHNYKQILAFRLSAIKEIEMHPDDFFYFSALAVRSDVPNGNGDIFPDDEVRRRYTTFIGTGIYANHDSFPSSKALGVWVDAVYDPEEKCVYVVGVLDKRVTEKRFPGLIAAIENGDVTDVSMGAWVERSICSFCGNVACNESEYCEHILFQKGREVTAADGSKVVVAEINDGVTWFECSLIFERRGNRYFSCGDAVGADSKAKIAEVYAKKEEEDLVSCLVSYIEERRKFEEVKKDRMKNVAVAEKPVKSFEEEDRKDTEYAGAEQLEKEFVALKDQKSEREEPEELSSAKDPEDYVLAQKGRVPVILASDYLKVPVKDRRKLAPILVVSEVADAPEVVEEIEKKLEKERERIREERAPVEEVSERIKEEVKEVVDKRITDLIKERVDEILPGVTKKSVVVQAKVRKVVSNVLKELRKICEDALSERMKVAGEVRSEARKKCLAEEAEEVKRVLDEIEEELKVEEVEAPEAEAEEKLKKIEDIVEDLSEDVGELKEVLEVIPEKEKKEIEELAKRNRRRAVRKLRRLIAKVLQQVREQPEDEYAEGGELERSFEQEAVDAASKTDVDIAEQRELSQALPADRIKLREKLSRAEKIRQLRKRRVARDRSEVRERILERRRKRIARDRLMSKMNIDSAIERKVSEEDQLLRELVEDGFDQ